jgi:hypothetical protein
MTLKHEFKVLKALCVSKFLYYCGIALLKVIRLSQLFKANACINRHTTLDRPFRSVTVICNTIGAG